MHNQYGILHILVCLFSFCIQPSNPVQFRHKYRSLAKNPIPPQGLQYKVQSGEYGTWQESTVRDESSEKIVSFKGELAKLIGLLER
jgi:hypothetical protein